MKRRGSLLVFQYRAERVSGDLASPHQLAGPICSFQSLITAGGNSRSPRPTRRQASGHILSRI